RASGSVTLIGWASGPPLGTLPGARFQDQSYALDDGDVVVFMTDGVLEALEDESSGFSTLTQLVEEAREGIGEVHCSVLGGVGVEALEHAIDDITLLSLQVRTHPTEARPTIY